MIEGAIIGALVGAVIGLIVVIIKSIGYKKVTGGSLSPQFKGNRFRSSVPLSGNADGLICEAKQLLAARSFAPVLYGGEQDVFMLTGSDKKGCACYIKLDVEYGGYGAAIQIESWFIWRSAKNNFAEMQITNVEAAGANQEKAHTYAVFLALTDKLSCTLPPQSFDVTPPQGFAE